MNPSKKNCKMAQAALDRLLQSVVPNRDISSEAALLREFLEAARRKLPNEKSFKRKKKAA